MAIMWALKELLINTNNSMIILALSSEIAVFTGSDSLFWNKINIPIKTPKAVL